MSGQFCTNRISINTRIRASFFSLELKSWSTKSSLYRMFRVSRYATNRSENVCSRWSASIIAFLSMRKSLQSVIAVADPCVKAVQPSHLLRKTLLLLNLRKTLPYSICQELLPCRPVRCTLASPLTVAASAVAAYIVEYEPSNANDLVSA
jgi:hypothetical protein